MKIKYLVKQKGELEDLYYNGANFYGGLEHAKLYDTYEESQAVVEHFLPKLIISKIFPGYMSIDKVFID